MSTEGQPTRSNPALAENFDRHTCGFCDPPRGFDTYEELVDHHLAKHKGVAWGGQPETAEDLPGGRTDLEPEAE